MNKVFEVREAENQEEDVPPRGEAGSETVSVGMNGPDASPKAAKAFDIDIFRGWCKSCGICAAFCPRGCISLDENGSPIVHSPERCTGCGWCELHCPDFAISVHQRTAARAREEE